MRIRAYDELIPRVLPLVLSCPRTLALDALQATGVDFCRESEAWIEEFDETVWNGDPLIEVSVDRGQVITKILSLYIGGSAIDHGFYDPRTGSVVLRSTPSYDSSAHITAVMRPSRTASGLPEAIMEEWGDVLAAGALTRLKLMTGQNIEWSDPQGAAYHKQIYDEGAALARIQALRSRHGNSLLLI